VFERFTERARQVVVLAQEEARAFRHNYIGTEHLLLGLLREEEGVGGRALEALDVSLDEVRVQVARIIGTGEESTPGQIPFTPRSKRVLEHALREALSLGHQYIGTEHVLLGIAREPDGVAARILLEHDVDATKARDEVIRMLSSPRALSDAPVNWESLELEPEVRSLLEQVKADKEAAHEAQDFERAASLRAREVRLARLAQSGDAEAVRAAAQEPLLMPSPAPGRSPGMPRAVPRPRFAPAAAVADARTRPAALAVGWGLFGISLGLGILIGWLIWG
jgi:hypothetical protein